MQLSSDDSSLKDAVMQALRRALENEEPIIISPKNKPVSLFSYVEAITDDFITIHNSMPLQMAPYLMSAPSFQILLGSYWIRFEKFVPHGRQLRLPVVDFGKLEMARASERQCFSEKDDVFVKIAHPFDSGTSLTRRVFDFSDGGMSFRTRLSTPFMQTGRHLSRLEIFRNGNLSSRHSGQVVYVKQIIDAIGNDYFQVGVRFKTPEEPIQGSDHV
jgi:hypothetical protein